MIQRLTLPLIFLATVCLYAFHLSILGIEFYGDEIFYFKSTQEMLRSGDFLSPSYMGENRFQKPILYYWFILICYEIFGAGWFAARLPGVLFAGLAAVFTWLLARRMFNRRIAWLSSIVLVSTMLFYRFARVAVPDMTMNFFIVWSCFHGYLFLENPNKKHHRILFFLAMGLGFMVKGFAALVVPLLSVLVCCLWMKEKKKLLQINLGLGFLIFFAVVLPWFIYMILRHGQTYLDYMLITETKERLVSDAQVHPLIGQILSFKKNFGYYSSMIATKMLPWSFFLVFALPFAFIFRAKNEGASHTRAVTFLLGWFLSTFVFFCFVHIMHEHYLLVLTTPFAILIAVWFCKSKFDAVWLDKLANWFSRPFLLILLFLGLFILTFFGLIFLKFNALWVLFCILAAVGIFVLFKVFKKERMVAPAILGIFILLLASQAHVLAKTGLTKQNIYRSYAERITQGESATSYNVGVGSKDIRHSDIQLFFDEPITRIPEDNQVASRKRFVKQLFERDARAYCFILEKDYEELQSDFNVFEHEIVAEHDLIKRKFRLDSGFVKAFLALNVRAIKPYLFDNLLLIKERAR